MFSQAETEALVLGMRWVSRRGDSQLASAAGQALAKIADVLPPALREELEANTLLIAPVQAPPVADAMRVLIRDTIRRERKLHIDYLDLAGQRSERLLWPFALGFRAVPDAGRLVRAAPGVSPFSPRSHSGRYAFGTALSARSAAAVERVAPQRGHCGAIAARCCHKLSVAPLSLYLSGAGRFPSPRGQTDDPSQHDPALRRQPAEQRRLLSTFTGTGAGRAFPGFALFVLNNGFKLGMWAKQG